MKKPIKTAAGFSFALFIAAALLFTPAQVSASELNLNETDLFIKKGFSTEWTSDFKSDDGWKRIEASPRGRAVRLHRMNDFTGAEKQFFRMTDNKPQHFTIAIPFQWKKTSTVQPEFTGLNLSSIGDNWEIYLNGTLLRSEMFLDADGYIKTHRHSIKVLINLPDSILKEGGNLLTFHICGDTASPFTGFFRSSPYTIGSYTEQQKSNSETSTLILIFLFLAVGIYHINLYIIHSDEKYNLLYAAASTVYFLYVLSKTAFIREYIPQSDILVRVEFITVFLLFPFFGAFFELIIINRISLLMKGTAVLYGLFAAAVLFLPIPAAFNLLTVWQATAIIPLLYSTVYLFGYSFYSDVKSIKNEFNISTGRALLDTIRGRVSGNLIAGGVITALCVMFDILDAIYFYKGLMISQYGFTFTILGMSVVLSNRFLFIQKKIRTLNNDLHVKMNDLSEAYKTISVSEERYRFLVEGSNEIIFRLDEDFRFISCSRAVDRILLYSPGQMLGKKITELAHAGEKNMSFTGNMIEEKLNSLLADGQPAKFTTGFKSAFNEEPVELLVTLEYISVDGRKEILGRMGKIGEDSLLKFFHSEKQSYSLPNYLNTAEEITRRVTRNLTKFISNTEIKLIRMSLREIIINAIEHGNLEITYREKSEAINDGSYRDLLKSRQEDPRFSGRAVRVDVSINDDKAVFMITDEGGGFDPSEFDDSADSVNDDMRPHGRGLIMTRNVFDHVEFIDKGNRVRLTKFIRT